MSFCVNDTILQFLELYREERLLWDRRDLHYKSRPERQEAWLRIQSSMGEQFTVEDLKKKKESLMSMFRSYLHKSKTNPDCKITWFAFPLMNSFLSPIYLDEEPDDQYNNVSYTESRDAVQSITVTVPPNPPRQSAPPPARHKVGHRPPKRLYPDSSQNTVQSSKTQETDECELYAQLLVKKLRRLNEHQRDIAMHEIDNILFRVKTQNNPSVRQSQYTMYSDSPVRKTKSPVFIASQEEDTVEYQDIPEQDPVALEQNTRSYQNEHNYE